MTNTYFTFTADTTPSWYKAERYEYCDSSVESKAKSFFKSLAHIFSLLIIC